MKNSLACIKCQSRVLWCIDPFRAPDDYSNTHGDPIFLAKNAGGAYGNESTGRLELWLCNECGYSELWAHDFAHLTPDPANGIRRIDARPQRGTFR